MKSLYRLWAIGAILVAGCSTERYDGGFETSDLSARVLTPSGEPAVGARVWLVRTHGDSLPGTAVDSAWTGPSGLATFTVPRSEDRSTLGFDGKLDDWLVIAQNPLLHSDSARITLNKTQTVSAGAAQDGELPKLFVPGSHFLSTLSSNGNVVLTIPRGTWTIAKSFSAGTMLGTIVRPMVVVDTTPIALDSLPKPVDTTKKTVVAHDSLRFDGLTYYADSTFPLPIAWDRDTGWLDSCRLMAGMVSDDTGTFVLETRPTWIANGADTQNVQGGAEIATGELPDSGTLAIQFLYPQTFLNDTVLLRTMRLTDSVGAGSLVKLGNPTDTVLTNQGPLTTPSGGQSTAPSPLQAGTWYFSWNPTRITVRADTALVGTVTTQITFHRLRFRLAATTLHVGRSSLLRLAGVRLYKPK